MGTVTEIMDTAMNINIPMDTLMAMAMDTLMVRIIVMVSTESSWLNLNLQLMTYWKIEGTCCQLVVIIHGSSFIKCSTTIVFCDSFYVSLAVISTLIFKDFALPLVFECVLQCCVLAKDETAVCYCYRMKLVIRCPVSIFSLKPIDKVELFCYCSPFV